MTFRNNFNSEFSDGVFWDGGVLEVSAPNISGGDFLDSPIHTLEEASRRVDTPERSVATHRIRYQAGWHGAEILADTSTTVINMGPNLDGQTSRSIPLWIG